MTMSSSKGGYFIPFREMNLHEKKLKKTSRKSMIFIFNVFDMLLSPETLRFSLNGCVGKRKKKKTT
jgi:hypothetical protein